MRIPDFLILNSKDQLVNSPAFCAISPLNHRRLQYPPTAIDELLNPAFVPASSNLWFQNKISAACTLEQVIHELDISFRLGSQLIEFVGPRASHSAEKRNGMERKDVTRLYE